MAISTKEVREMGIWRAMASTHQRMEPPIEGNF